MGKQGRCGGCGEETWLLPLHAEKAAVVLQVGGTQSTKNRPTWPAVGMRIGERGKRKAGASTIGNGEYDAMSGRKSRDKGARTERAIAKLIGARKVFRAWMSGHDLELEVGDRVLAIEVKCRAVGFGQLYGWLDGSDVLILKADYQEPLVVTRLSLAAELMKEAGQAGVTAASSWMASVSSAAI